MTAAHENLHTDGVNQGLACKLARQVGVQAKNGVAKQILVNLGEDLQSC